MPRGIVVCRNPTRAESLKQIIMQDYECAFCETADGVVDSLSKGNNSSFVYFCFHGGAKADELELLLDLTIRKISLIIEMDDDEPRQAFDLIRRGAFYALPNTLTKSEKLLDVLSQASPGKRHPRFEPLSKVDRRTDPWGFMSMNWEFNHQDGKDFNRGVLPAREQLRLQLQRLDEFYQEGSGVRRRVEAAIKDRPVLVAMISPYKDVSGDYTNPNARVFPPSPNVMFEVGAASVLKREILLLYRDTGRGAMVANQTVPAILKGDSRVEYSTYTELALKLFFGLGGQADEILEWDKLS